MIINPSFLYPDLIYSPWVYAGRFSKKMMSLPSLNVICACQSQELFKHKSFSDVDEITIEQMSVISVLMKVDVFCNKYAPDDIQRVQIWAGKCPKCDNIYWNCDSFEWAGWATDLQTVTMLTSAIPLNHMSSDTDRYLTVQGDTTIRFDKKGKIEEVY